MYINTMRSQRKILFYLVLGNTLAGVIVYFVRNSLGSANLRHDSTYSVDFSVSSIGNNALVNRSDKFEEYESTMRRKLDKIDEKCQKNVPYWKTMTPNGIVWNYEKLHLHYCIVPKVGCTFWKRIIRFVSHDYHSRPDIRRPSDLDRYFVHYATHPKIKEYSMNDETHRKSMANKAFMFSRDPYARLWSGYIDKFFLPDFWGKGTEVGIFANENPTREEMECNNGMTFKDFLKSITRIWQRGLNEHFAPIYMLCSPCHVKFAAIGKMENFADDADFILTKYGIHLNQTISKKDMVYEEIKTLTKYNFEIAKIIGEKCVHKMDVAQRLWKAFQYNGYIDRLTSFPNEELEAANFEFEPTRTFTEIAIKTIGNQTTDFKSQKRSMMLEAYSEIPKELLDKIKHIYTYDFELFGYNTDLFN